MILNVNRDRGPSREANGVPRLRGAPFAVIRYTVRLRGFPPHPARRRADLSLQGRGHENVTVIVLDQPDCRVALLLAMTG